MLATCSDDGSVIITNLISYRQEVLHKNNLHKEEIKKVLFLDPHNCLLIIDSRY